MIFLYLTSIMFEILLGDLSMINIDSRGPIDFIISIPETILCVRLHETEC